MVIIIIWIIKGLYLSLVQTLLVYIISLENLVVGLINYITMFYNNSLFGINNKKS